MDHRSEAGGDLPPTRRILAKRRSVMGRLPLAVMSALVLACLLVAQARPEATDASDWEYDKYNGQDILETCAGCHGKNAAGGMGGEYPRLAGLDERYITRQLRAFKVRERINIPMYPYATERELPPDDVRDIARFLSQIELETRPPDPDAEMSAYERLLAAEAAFNVPRVDGDIERGGELYEDECSDCHGEEGWGEDDVPQLAGQHINYLRRQVQAFRAGERNNEDMDGLFDEITAEDLEDLFAYLASRDD